MKTFLIVILITLLMNCTPEKKPTSQLVTLSNKQIEIGLIPEVGGVLVHASLLGQKNILQSDTAFWNESPDKRPSLNPKARLKSYKGHISWVSPQSEWWIHQDSIPELKKARAAWPPDPMLTVAPYQITSQTANEITLVGPESPYSKVQFTKIYRISGNKVTLTTRARNCSDTIVKWGLWHNTRMNGWDFVFVQADSSALRKTEYHNRGNVQKPELHYRNGFFTYDATAPESAKVVYKSKSFLDVKTPLIAGFHQNQWLIIRSEAIDNSQIHPEQSRIELYIENSYQAANDIQELEMQFAYQAIAPGASIEATETWEILPGSGLTDKYEVLEELRGKLK
jgi:hypothetical protein